MNKEVQEYYEKIMDEKVNKFKEFLKKYDEIEENLFHELMIQIIEEAPEEIHNHLFVKFTYMLGVKLEIPKRIISDELIKN